jgi:predicted nucleic acid-binding protein
VTGALYLDTSGWFAAMSPRERLHATASDAYRRAIAAGNRLVTTDLVVAEMHTLLLRWRDQSTGSRFLDLVYQSGTHTVIHADEDLIADSLAHWIRRFSDQRFTLCDAVSFEVMRRERLTNALAIDSHFATAGFQILA